jgi:hypothetical protein
MNKHIFRILLSFALALPAATSFAQPHGGGGAQIESVKAEYLTRRLDLSPEEAQRFWPVYRNYQRDIGKVLQERRKARQDQKTSGEQVDELEFEEDLLDVKKKYRKEFSDVLPPQKVNLLYQAEKDFKEELLKQLKDRRKQ